MKTPTYSFGPIKIALITAIMVSLIALITGTIYGLSPNKPIVKEYAIEYPAPLSSLTAGCGNFFLFNEDNLDKIISGDANIVLPVAGATDSPAMDMKKRFYSFTDKDLPNLDTVTSTMYQKNATIIWYSQDANAEDIEIAKTYAEENIELNIIILPWTGKNGDKAIELPLGRLFGITSWGTSQSCVTPNNLTYDSYFNFLQEQSSDKTKKPATINP